jgi:ribose 5-phosphate isomerase
MAHWNRKHASAAFVPSCRRGAAESREYRYGEVVRLGTGTTFENFLRALAAAAVFYDPRIKVVREGRTITTKRRSQFRSHIKRMPALYGSFEVTGSCN